MDQNKCNGPYMDYAYFYGPTSPHWWWWLWWFAIKKNVTFPFKVEAI